MIPLGTILTTPDAKSGGSNIPPSDEAVPICLNQELKHVDFTREQSKEKLNLAALIVKSNHESTNVTQKRNNSKKGFSDEQLTEFAKKISSSYSENLVSPKASISERFSSKFEPGFLQETPVR